MSLLRDVYSFGQLQVLSEGTGNSPMRVRGLFQEAETVNGNKRRYPTKLLEREVKKLGSVLSERRLVGELDHPSDEVVHLTNASHLITGLQMEGNKVIGEAEILNTPSGKVLQELLKAGVKIGISSRAVGGLTFNNDDECYEVNDNLRMITWDMVSDPSCQGAFPGLMENNQNLNEHASKAVEEVQQITAERIYIKRLEQSLRKK